MDGRNQDLGRDHDLHDRPLDAVTRRVRLAAALLASVWVETVGTFAVGEEGTVLSFDGEAWNLVDVPTEVDLRTIWGTDDRLFVAGGAPDADYAILQYFEDEWTVVDEGKGIVLGMDGRAIDDIFAVGGKEDTSSNELSCMALHFDGSRWDSVDCGSAHYLWDVVTLSNGRTHHFTCPWADVERQSLR